MSGSSCSSNRMFYHKECYILDPRPILDDILCSKFEPIKLHDRGTLSCGSTVQRVSESVITFACKRNLLDNVFYISPGINVQPVEEF